MNMPSKLINRPIPSPTASPSTTEKATLTRNKNKYVHQNSERDALPLVEKFSLVKKRLMASPNDTSRCFTRTCVTPVGVPHFSHTTSWSSSLAPQFLQNISLTYLCCQFPFQPPYHSRCKTSNHLTPACRIFHKQRSSKVSFPMTDIVGSTSTETTDQPLVPS